MATTVVKQVLDIPAIRAQLHGPTGGVARDMLRRALRVQTRARKLCPVDKGRLRGDINLAQVRRSSYGDSVSGYVIGTNVDYALFVHNGTGIYGPHGVPIVPTRAKVLVFTKGGQKIYARSVKGQRGIPFLKNALPAARG